MTTAGDLTRVPVGSPPQVVAMGVDTFSIASERSLLLTRAVPDPEMTAPEYPGQPPAKVTASLFDTTTLTETPLPDGPLDQQGVQFSPDGRWLTVNQPSMDPGSIAGSTLLVDALTGTLEALDGPFGFFPYWRPGHAEMWASPYDPDGSGALSASAVYIKRPGEPVVVIPGRYFSGFNEDGTYWFSRGASFNAQESSDLVGLADDPTGPRFPAVPNGSTLNFHWTVGDGPQLVESSIGLDSFQSLSVNLVDPRNGQTRLIGERGYLAAVGKTRVLGLYHTSFLRGDLTTSDYASGQSTVLAAEFAVSAVAEPQDGDAYPPGSHVAYEFRARFASPWDGLWLATAP